MYLGYRRRYYREPYRRATHQHILGMGMQYYSRVAYSRGSLQFGSLQFGLMRRVLGCFTAFDCDVCVAYG